MLCNSADLDFFDNPSDIYRCNCCGFIFDNPVRYYYYNRFFFRFSRMNLYDNIWIVAEKTADG